MSVEVLLAVDPGPRHGLQRRDRGLGYPLDRVENWPDYLKCDFYTYYYNAI